MSEVTRILGAIEAGDTQASEQLLPLVYEELRKLAAHKLAKERPGQTLQATALVHEAYVRLVDVDRVRQWNSKGHFFAAAATAMERLLVEQGRRRSAAKRGGNLARDELHPSEIASPTPNVDILALHDALDQLATSDPDAASLVRLRFFAGLNMTEAAESLDMSVRSAHDIWAFARSWLHRKLRAD
jgi:RNA polymerase sigma factor (TIGR02999 family)